MENQLVPLTHDAYQKKVKLRGWNCKTSALSCRDPKTAVLLIRRFGPVWTSEEHASIAKYHAQRAAKLFAVWEKILNRAAAETLGRPWRVSDYRVSAIGREEFSLSHKRVLRHCIHRGHEHEDMAKAHAALAKLTQISNH